MVRRSRPTLQKCHSGQLFRNNHDGSFTDATSKPVSPTVPGDLASLLAITTTMDGKTFTLQILAEPFFITTIATAHFQT